MAWPERLEGELYKGDKSDEWDHCCLDSYVTNLEGHGE
jgi:hypothetical protein